MSRLEKEITELADGRIQLDVYRIHRSRSHHKDGGRSVGGERISSQILDAHTYLAKSKKGLFK
jgi:hypothetical protein